MDGTAVSQTVLEVKNLTKVFRVGFWGKKIWAVRDLDIDVRRNEIFGFLGPNGAGKTTTIKAILGLIYPTRGKIRLFGKPHSDVKIRSRIGFLPENPYFYDYLSAGEFMHFYGQLVNLPRSEKYEKSKELLKLVGLEDAAGIQLRKFSKGMLQRLGLAQALLGDPELIILDEPMSGLDPIGRKEIRDLILRMKENGKTVFFSTHILPDVEMICDRVGIIHSGRLSAVGTLSEILGSSLEGVEVTVSGITDEKAIDSVISRIVRQGDILHIALDDPNNLDGLLRKVLDQGGKIIEVFGHRRSLEDYFLEAVGEEHDDSEVEQ